jgi:hypothetical protein
MGRHGGRPSLNFSRFLAGKSVHVAPKKGPPFLDTRARPRKRFAAFLSIMDSLLLRIEFRPKWPPSIEA